MITTTKNKILCVFIFLINVAVYSQNVFPASSYVSLEKGESFSQAITLQVGNGDYTWNINNGTNLNINRTIGSLSNYQSTTITVSGINNYNTNFTQTYFFSVAFQNKATYIVTALSFSVTINYYLGCQDEIVISQDINSGEIDSQSAQNTISATNTINNGATANYDAGTTVFLTPNFHAKSGATFKAFIEGCSATSNKNIEVIEKTAISDAQKSNEVEDHLFIENAIRVYPNPTQEIFKISSDKIIVNYKVTSSLNKTLINSNVNNNEISVNIQDLAKGIYMVKATLDSGAVVVKKIIKK